MKKLECIKGMVDSNNINVVLMKGDILIVNEVNEGEVLLEGLLGWSEGFELSFSPEQIVDHFKVKY